MTQAITLLFFKKYRYIDPGKEDDNFMCKLIQRSLLFYLFMCSDFSFQVISFFSSRLEQAGAELSVERVLEIIKQGAVALPKDRLRVSAQDLLN